MSAVRKMIKHPGTDKRLSRVFVKGKGWFGWNSAYHVYNSVTNYAQLQEGEVGLIKFNLSDSINQKGDTKMSAKELVEIVNELVEEDTYAEEEEVQRHTDLRDDCP